MLIQINAQETRYMQNYKPIDSEVDKAYREFYIGFFSNPDPSKLISDYLPIIKKAIQDYFQRTQDDTEIQKDIINNLTYIWNYLRDLKQYWWAEKFWEEVLEIVKVWEVGRGKRIHKGSIYYYWGGTSLATGNIDEAFLLMHKSYEEDVKTYQSNEPNSSAYKFVSLDFQKTDYNFQDYIASYKDFIDIHLKLYCTINGSTLNIEDFKNKFLDILNDKSLKFAFAHMIAKLDKLTSNLLATEKSTFSSIYIASLFSDLLVFLEVAMDEKGLGGLYKQKIYELTSKNPAVSLSQDELGNINGSANINFDQTLKDLIANNFVAKGKRLTQLQCDIGIAYIIRNQSAHNIVSSEEIFDSFSQIKQSIFNNLFLIVDLLYI